MENWNTAGIIKRDEKLNGSELGDGEGVRCMIWKKKKVKYGNGREMKDKRWGEVRYGGVGGGANEMWRKRRGRRAT